MWVGKMLFSRVAPLDLDAPVIDLATRHVYGCILPHPPLPVVKPSVDPASTMALIRSETLENWLAAQNRTMPRSGEPGALRAILQLLKEFRARNDSDS